MLYPVTIWTWPLALLARVLDTWLVFAVLYLVACRFCAHDFRPQSSWLCPIVEGPVQLVRQQIVRWRHHAGPSRLSWAVTFIAVAVLRHVLTCAIGAPS